MAAEMTDIIQELNNSLRNNEIDLYEIEYLPEKFGPQKIVFNDRVGVDYDTRKIVIYLEAYDIYACIEGYYSSYNGTDFSNSRYFEVKPVEKNIIHYQSV